MKRKTTMAPNLAGTAESLARPRPDYPEHPDYAVAALLQMLVRYPMVDCPTLAHSISAHLNLIATDTRFGDMVRHVAANSAGEWEAMVAMRATLARHQAPG